MACSNNGAVMAPWSLQLLIRWINLGQITSREYIYVEPRLLVELTQEADQHALKILGLDNHK